MMAEEDDTGYSYPISSKVVQKVLTELRIQQAIEENRLAIEQIQIPGVLTFEDIWRMGFVNADWVNAKIKSTERVLTSEDISAMGFVNAEWVQAQIEATERVLNFDDILGMGFITGDWVGEQGFATSSWVDFNFFTKNEILFDIVFGLRDGELAKWGYLTESQIQAMVDGLGYLTESQITDLIGSMAVSLSFQDIWDLGYRDENWINEQGYSTEGWVQNYVTGLGLAPTSWVEGNFVSSADFSSFLKGYLTPEFIDDLTGTLMDVTVNDIKMNLVDALEGRPTFLEVPFVDVTLRDGGTGTLEGFLSENHDRILGTFNLSDFLKDTLLVKTLGVGGSRIKQFDTCFRGTGSGLEGLVSSLKDDIGGVRNNFSLIKDYMGNVGGAFETLRASLADIRGRITFGISEETMTLILQTIENFATDEKANFDAIKSEFSIAKDLLDKLSGKADQLKTCGANNLEW